MQTGRDPRDIITPAAFTVAPDLLGFPLARPWRRAAAILIDLAVCGVLVVLLEAPSILLAAAASFLVYRLVRRPRADATRWTKTYRFTLGCGFAIVAFGLSAAALGSIGRALWNAGDEREEPAAARTVSLPMLDAGLTIAEGAALFRASSPEEADEIARRIRDRLVDAGLSGDEVAEMRTALDEMESDGGLNPVAVAALRRSFAELDTAAPETARPDADSLALEYTAAVSAGDSGRAAAIRPTLSEALAADRVASLERRNRRLTRTIARLEDEAETLEEASRSGGLRRLIRTLADDLGLGFGWLMLYFTAFTMVWRGYTPGKRLLGIRVIRLDGRPIGGWNAFERFGGYSAALATGLLGFAQILWDRNRQAIHDKIASTVVVQERGAPRSTPEEAAASVQAAADGALDGGGDEIVAGEGDTSGEPGGVEAREVP